MPKFYVTTSIAYVNGSPHIGYASELVQGDVLARWHRLLGDDTFFLTGTDENSQKLLKVAEAENTTPQAIADRYTAEFQKLTKALNLSNDEFIRTTDQTRHWPGATALWQKLTAADLIYKGIYKGFYCIGCERYYQPKELKDGVCPIHHTKPEELEEENYFFKLSQFSGQLHDLISSGEYHVEPATRRHEILEVLKSGLQDISFSRPAQKLAMGVPVPGDDTQKMYVWCDALTNYISAIGYGRNEASFNQWWPADVHLIGKDIIRFHAAIWPAMLLGANLPLPKKLYVHGFYTVEGTKMSKSLGNVIDPFELVEQHGTDAVRYYLLHSLPFAGDGNYAAAHFSEIYLSHLANDLGNLVSRVVAMLVKEGGQVPRGTADPHLKEHVGQTHHELKNLLDECRFAEALELLHRLVSQANKFVDTKEPYKQTGQDKADTLYTLAQVVGHLALLYEPFLPETAGKIRSLLNVSGDGWNPEALLEWEKLPPGTTVTKGSPLFPKP